MSVIYLPEDSWAASSCVGNQQRDSLARFWLAAPDDLLPSLWGSPLGQSTKELVKQLNANSSFSDEQNELRNAIGERLKAGFGSPNAIQMLLAAWLFSPPGLMKIANAETVLPNWLIQDYKEMYELSGEQIQASSAPSNINQEFNPEASNSDIPDPDFGEFPSTLQELVNNRIHLNRMLGLANLYFIDPEDIEIRDELRKLRLDLASLIEGCSENELEALWSTDLGDRFWALVRSGIQKEENTGSEEEWKQKATAALQPSNGGGFGVPGAINSFLIAMLFYEPGTMRVDAPEQKLPGWLLLPYQQVFAESLPTGG